MPVTPTDAELVDQALSGSQAAYHALVSRYATPAVNLAARMVQDRALAEDLAQEAFARAFERLGIPLLLLAPFGVVLAVVLMLVGFTGIACQVGRYVSNRFGIKRGPYATVALRVAVIFAISLIARLFALGGAWCSA